MGVLVFVCVWVGGCVSVCLFVCVWGGGEIVEEGETYIQQQLHSERGENEERGRLVEETTAYRYT